MAEKSEVTVRVRPPPTMSVMIPTASMLTAAYRVDGLAVQQAETVSTVFSQLCSRPSP